MNKNFVRSLLVLLMVVMCTVAFLGCGKGNVVAIKDYQAKLGKQMEYDKRARDSEYSKQKFSLLNTQTKDTLEDLQFWGSYGFPTSKLPSTKEGIRFFVNGKDATEDFILEIEIMGEDTWVNVYRRAEAGDLPSSGITWFELVFEE